MVDGYRLLSVKAKHCLIIPQRGVSQTLTGKYGR